MSKPTMIPIRTPNRPKGRAGRRALLAALVLLTAFSLVYIRFDAAEFLLGIPIFIRFLFEDFLPPNPSHLQGYLKPVADTLIYAVIATFCSSVLGVALALLMARSTTPHPAVRTVLRGLLSLLRNIPFLAWASLLVVIFGVGTTAGLIALILFGCGFLARLYAESIEELDRDSIEALEACGATYGQRIRHAIIPQFLPAFYSWTLFMFEINIRASAVLGLVGAGGIGSLIKQTMDLFQYGKTSMVITIMIVMILAVELVTNQIRRRII
ncbi:phosphonate ABC transporter permease [Paenibacillus mucilaginosus 3016]|uniref:Phosphonate ABC transporter permease n=2 Tax=Paenibacillus mucilaginosus TaxID=61624 RepID=H6NI35_9BACL|nr:phosphonate ABC transporter, permease protein PhnE [Paenibacillus mucilaginosus]AFC30806.1 phosphonate ABC transporter permease [Paenibacillus mucilaginosus 3016]AFH63128.1 phosphonate ABC transporter permease [Paenibacillus mucilaginosus K02]WFA19412.1 phosphonate ABC transporter, permease protein PhnE [Paenibacillus mucilaginosus]